LQSGVCFDQIVKSI